MVGWRKLVGVMFVVTLAFILTLLGLFTAAWANFGSAAVIALAGGNAAEHLASAWKTANGGKDER